MQKKLATAVPADMLGLVRSGSKRRLPAHAGANLCC